MVLSICNIICTCTCTCNTFNTLFAVGGHVTTATLNQSAMTKWYPEM